KEGLPKWYPPLEAWAESVGGYEKSKEAAKYPLVYSTYRNKLRCHTQFGWNSWLLELFPEPIVMVNSKEIEKRGLKHGDMVRLFNDRGEVVLRLVENDAVRAGMVVVPKGWYGDFFVKGHYSNLTGRNQRPAATNNYFFDALCEMEKYEGSVN
ncbi:MAG: molybdopterin oxidoreductase, partial [Eggerthellaceae bacterium]|nr:molybdopterin oxidoreductase [Eggerthellaceae bacterium]